MKKITILFLHIIFLISIFLPLLAEGSKEKKKKDQRSTNFAAYSEENYSVSFASILEKKWYALPVTSGKEDRGFRPLFVPFSVAGSETGEALLFPVLLSFKFDFIPSNYNSFQGALPLLMDKELQRWIPPSSGMKDFTEKDTELIKSWHKRYNTNYTVTGSIRQEKTGYRGTLQVLDVSGISVFRYDVADPVDYFRLMGKMSEAYLRFRGHEMPALLQKELYRPMTEEQESLKTLQTLLAKTWMSDLLGWQDMVNRWPRFGEAVYLFTRQLSQKGGYEDNINNLLGEALSDHLVIFALKEFDPSESGDRIKTYEKKLVEAVQTDSRNPNLVYLYLRRFQDKLTPPQLEQFNLLAASYPGHYHIQRILGSAYLSRSSYEKAVPLFLSAANSGVSPTELEKDYLALTISFWHMGYVNEALYFAILGHKYGSKENRGLFLKYAGISARELFRFKKGATYLEAAFKENRDSYSLINALLALYEAGAADEAQKLAKKYIVDLTGNKELIEIRQKGASGNYSQATKLLEEYLNSRTLHDEELLLEAALLGGDLKLLQEDLPAARKYLTDAWFLSPGSRRGAYLLMEAYRDKKEITGRFAEVLLFLYPNDEFGKNALEELTARGYFPEENAAIINRYNAIAEEISGLPEKQLKGYWLKGSPFEIEYLTLRLVKMDVPAYRDGALKLYFSYANAVEVLSEYQKAHIRTFFYRLIAGFPAMEKLNWIDLFETR